MTLERGLYEQILTEALAAQFPAPGGRVVPLWQGLHQAEAADRLALHLARIVEQALQAIPEKERVAVGTSLVRGLIDALSTTNKQAGCEQVAEALRQERPLAPGELLQTMLGRLPDGSTESIPSPLLPLLDTALLTNAPASYVEHEREMPTAVTWRLTPPLPGDLFSSFAAAVA